MWAQYLYRRLGGILVLVMTVAASATCARADSDQTAIKQRLQRWTAAFNARDAAGYATFLHRTLSTQSQR